MKILLSSNSIFLTCGYAIQCFELLKSLVKMGHEVSLLSWNTVITQNEEEKFNSVDFEKYIETINCNSLSINKEHEEICKDIRFYGCLRKISLFYRT